jgi:hypothetical protein
MSTDTRPARADLTLTIKARLDGFDTEICFSGSVDQLLNVTKRLRELGAEPASTTVQAQPQARKPTQKRVQPVWNGAGEATVPNTVRRCARAGGGCSARRRIRPAATTADSILTSNQTIAAGVQLGNAPAPPSHIGEHHDNPGHRQP